MAEEKTEFMHVENIRAEALGEPGERTFRILVDGDAGSAMMWLEKEQLFQLAVAINQLHSSLPELDRSRQISEGAEEFGVRLEFKVGRLVLGHEGSSERLIIDAHDAESDEEEQGPTVRIWAERQQLARFAADSLELCAAGRPLCPLCDSPMDPAGHTCPRSNGHALQDLNEL
ncbi:MAG: DUF3090 family protein [SAR202 cluster bacterium]|nr:DUF3090 family protein [SAR202 cluster bacterium]